MEHFEGDECKAYRGDAELRVIGYRNPVAADDIEVGDFINDPGRDRPDTWFEVDDVYVEEGGRVHLFVVDATAAEVTQARRDACEGHETTRGAIGDTFYCDGSCVR